MCALCRAEAATDPWAVCPGCVTRLPARMYPPTLSPAGVAVCLELRARLLAGEAPAEIPPSLVVVPGGRWESPQFRPKRLRRRAA